MTRTAFAKAGLDKAGLKTRLYAAVALVIDAVAVTDAQWPRIRRRPLAASDAPHRRTFRPTTTTAFRLWGVIGLGVRPPSLGAPARAFDRLANDPSVSADALRTLPPSQYRIVTTASATGTLVIGDDADYVECLPNRRRSDPGGVVGPPPPLQPAAKT